MFGELPNLSDSAKEALAPHLHVHTAKPAPKLKGRFTRFFQQFSGLFANQKKVEKDSLLIGRIHELESSGKQVLDGLLSVRAAIGPEVDPLLASAAISLIDPIVREIRSLLAQLETKQDPAQQVKAYNRYADSLEKGKSWIAILSNGEKGAEFQEFIKIKMVEEFHIRIERDLQLVHDYLEHALARPELNHPDKNSLADTLRAELAPLLENLQQLKQLPGEFDLDAFFKWRSEGDDARARWIEAALQAVDLQLNSHTREHL
jgi:hypothetical protein